MCIVAQYTDSARHSSFEEFLVFVSENTKLRLKSTRSPFDHEMRQQEILYLDRFAHKPK